MATNHLYLIGTAGCGKSTLTHALQVWLQNQGYDSITVNLDPGADSLLYAPDVDVRDWISLPEVMEQYGLGPNGAQVAAADMLALNVKEIGEVVKEFDADYVLIDTPGQIELFAFRQSSAVVVDEISAEDAVLAYLFDPTMAKTANGFVSSLMLSATVHFRLPFPMITILSKSDTVSDMDWKRIESWSSDYYSLFNSLLDESVDAQTQVNAEFLQALEAVGASRGLIPVSADTGEGLEDVYAMVQQILEAGEDVER